MSSYELGEEVWVYSSYPRKTTPPKLGVVTKVARKYVTVEVTTVIPEYVYPDWTRPEQTVVTEGVYDKLTGRDKDHFAAQNGGKIMSKQQLQALEERLLALEALKEFGLVVAGHGQAMPVAKLIRMAEIARETNG